MYHIIMYYSISYISIYKSYVVVLNGIDSVEDQRIIYIDNYQ